MAAEPAGRSRSKLVPMISVVVALIAVVVGIVVGVQRGSSSNTISDIITRPAPELTPGAHLLLPNLHKAQVVVPDRPHDPGLAQDPDRFARLTRLRRFEVSTNSRGFRGPEVEEPKERFRIVCLGDSVTFGWGLPVEQSYPHLLAERLGVEVINTGVPAMKPASMAAWASQELTALQPDLVLFTRRPHHMAPDPYRDYQEALRTVRTAAGQAPVVVVMPPVSTFDAMGSQVYQQEARQVRQISRPLPVLDLTEAFRAALPLPGVVMETDGRVQRVRQHPSAQIVLEAAAPQAGLAEEIVAMFEEDHSVMEPLFFDGGHPDKPGFELFVDTLASYLIQLGVVSAP